MKKYRGLLISSIILIIIGLSGTIYLGFFTNGSNKGMPCGLNKGIVSNIDRHFIEQMIPHHEDAIEMSKLALSRSQHKEIKELAEKIIENQSREINDMTSWYKSWYGTDVPETTTFGMGMMDEMTDLKALEDSEDFDKEFIRQMIPHHQMAVMMASMLLRSSERSEMQNLARNIIENQTEEINLMGNLYNKWY